MALPLLAGLPLLSKLVLGTSAAGLGVGAVRAATGTQLRKDEEEDELEGFRPSQSGLMELLEWAGQTAQPVQNLFAGRFDSAARHAFDAFIGKPLDAVLPGDAIPDLAKKSDFTSPSELLGMADAPWYAALPVNIAGDVLTSPLSAVTNAGKGAATVVQEGMEAAGNVGRTQAAAQATRAGGKLDELLTPGEVSRYFETPAQKAALPELLESQVSTAARKAAGGSRSIADEALEQSGGDVDKLLSLMKSDGAMADQFRQGGTYLFGQRVLPEGAISSLVPEPIKAGADKAIGALARATGNPRLTAGEKALLGTSRGAAMMSGRTALTNTMDILEKVPTQQREALWDVFQNVKPGDEGFSMLDSIASPTAPFEAAEQQVTRLMNRAAQHPGLADMPPEQLQDTITRMVDANRKLFAEDVREGVMRAPRMWHSAAGGLTPQDELFQAYEASGRQLKGDLAKLQGRIATKEKRLTELAAQRHEAAVSGAKGARKKKLLQMEADHGRVLDELEEARDELQEQLVRDADFSDWANRQGFEMRDVDVENLSPPDYLQRIIRGQDEADPASKLYSGRPSFTRGRSADTERLVELMNTPGITVERDALKVMANRAQQQGKAIGKAKLLRTVIGGDVTLADKETADLVTEAVANLSRVSPDFAKVVEFQLGKPAPHKGLMKLLNAHNRWWKPAVLYGIGIPRVAAMTKNRVGGLFQELSTEGAASSFDRLGKDLHGIVSDMMHKGFGWDAFPRDKMGKALDQMDGAFKAARGDVRLVKSELAKRVDDPEMARFMGEAMESGALEGFTDTESLLSLWAERLPKGVRDFMDMPGYAFQGVEHRMRLGQFMELRKRGTSPKEAARIVQSTYLDYTTMGVGDRTIRTLIPFAAFITRSVPQQGKHLARQPAAAVGYSGAFGNDQGAVLPPWVQEQASAVLGRDDSGNVNVAAGFGLPVETLNLLPSSLSPWELGETARRSVVASSAPLPKLGYSFVTGQDPYFQSPVGSYNRAPKVLQGLGADERGEAGRIYRLIEDTGLAQPLTTPIDLLDRALDERQAPGYRAMNLLSGARVVSVDENRAVRDLLQQELRNNPYVATYQGFYNRGENEEIDRLLQILGDTKKRIREQREAAAAPAP